MSFCSLSKSMFKYKHTIEMDWIKYYPQIINWYSKKIWTDIFLTLLLNNNSLVKVVYIIIKFQGISNIICPLLAVNAGGKYLGLLRFVVQRSVESKYCSGQGSVL